MYECFYFLGPPRMQSRLGERHFKLLSLKFRGLGLRGSGFRLLAATFLSMDSHLVFPAKLAEKLTRHPKKGSRKPRPRNGSKNGTPPI